MTNIKRIAILGGGPSALFLCKRLIESGSVDFEITIFEKKDRLGAGMPYSPAGANLEHVTNVSPNEIPTIVTTIKDWVKVAPSSLLEQYHIDVNDFNEYKVLPRLFFGEYLSAQFDLLLAKAKIAGIKIDVHLQSMAADVIVDKKTNKVSVKLSGNEIEEFDDLVICTGHIWPKKLEGKIKGYFESPYPPTKLAGVYHHPIAIKGSSLTAIDAIRTLARHNGNFKTDEKGHVTFSLSKESEGFKIVMHTRNGMLPAVRIHLEDSHLKHDSLLTIEELELHKEANGGFISLDFIFENDFKAQFKDKDPAFYSAVKDLKLEQFVHHMMGMRERRSAFEMLSIEYEEAERSIEYEKPIYWKEMLAVLSFSLNHPAKYLSAEDMLRLKQTLMPLISVIIAFVPQSSCKELFALHDAGVLDLVEVGEEATIEPQESGGIIYHIPNENGEDQPIHYQTFVDCVGQQHLSFDKVPFQTLVEQKVVAPARLQFKDASAGEAASAEEDSQVEKIGAAYFLNVPGIAIDDHYQVVNNEGVANGHIFMMAVPYIGGFNPDYSGLDFCEAASLKIAEKILEG